MSHETRKLELKEYGVENVNVNYTTAYRLKMEAIGTNMPSEIFIHRRGPLDPRTNLFKDEFEGVAGPVDMEVYPTIEPEPNTEFHFFRKAEFDILLPSTTVVEEARSVVLREAQTLVHALNRLENLTLLRVTTIGPYPNDPEHTSESEAL